MVSVMTVTGPIDAAEMGFALPHEHMMAKFQSYADWAKAPASYVFVGNPAQAFGLKKRLA